MRGMSTAPVRGLKRTPAAPEVALWAEAFTCSFVGGVCGEFDARQAAVRAAPDAASAQARAEGYASAAAKAEAECNAAAFKDYFLIGIAVSAAAAAAFIRFKRR